MDYEIIILIALITGFAFLFLKLNKLSQTDKEEEQLDSELDDKSKIYLQNAIDGLLKDENSKIFSILDEQKSAFDKFLISKGEIDQSIQNVNQQTMNLVSILTDNKSRGDFGEFTVEALLESAGYVEGSHFVKQDITKDGKKPDFTFYLGNNKKVNMDSKFPLEGYKRIIELEKDFKNPENDEVNKQNIQKSIDFEYKKEQHKEHLNKLVLQRTIYGLAGISISVLMAFLIIFIQFKQSEKQKNNVLNQQVDSQNSSSQSLLLLNKKIDALRESLKAANIAHNNSNITDHNYVNTA